ncbi:ATP-binding protein [Mycolicibacter sp. MYC123]|uniref:ATP-binding protein n=1 Tax=[Mycobacterium] zoologicum TaxID=2872311 RepID=A0ABU5YMJ4_9MYCO|nr:ATP-binding protein [Mycolicibacter sp. MYC123]MEB3051287.1 ATP-binding protein [Mycolicibacter sp. MYC123]
MAGRQLKEIFRAFHARDELAFRRAATEIIEEEQAKHHNALARDLQKLLVAGGGAVDSGMTVVVPAPPKDREGEWDLGEIREPERLLEDLVLRQAVSTALENIAEEVRQWPSLDAAGLPRRQRLLLQGPPGCGKTTAAEGVAAELGRPLLVVRLDAVVSSYLGETASNLRRILDYTNQAPFVVLFDEFDALGRSRDDASEHGEMKRVVTAFLQMTDRYRGPSLLLAATNHPSLLDEALWRRFDEVLTFELPTVHQIRQLLRLRLKSVSHSGLEIDQYASALKGLPHAAAEKLVIDARRNAILRNSGIVENEDMRKALPGITSRPW